jgi:hypothetical protein
VGNCSWNGAAQCPFSPTERRNKSRHKTNGWQKNGFQQNALPTTEIRVLLLQFSINPENEKLQMR